MSKTIEEGFRLFLGRLTPSPTETAAAKSHRASIEACLKANFECARFFRMGSFGNGTSIFRFSDVDYFASIPQKYITDNSTSTLKKVWGVLDARFPSTNVGIRNPAISVPFGENGSESSDVVPAGYVRQESNGAKIYKISDRSGGWMLASPDAQQTYVDGQNRRLGGKLKPLIRFMKAWKYFKQVPLYSFYLEMKVARYAAAESYIAYSSDLVRIFQLLASEELSMMQDPTGVSGYIRPCFSDAMKDDALSKLNTALGRAEKALNEESGGRISNAFGWWDLLFDGEFPAY